MGSLIIFGVPIFLIAFFGLLLDQFLCHLVHEIVSQILLRSPDSERHRNRSTNVGHNLLAYLTLHQAVWTSSLPEALGYSEKRLVKQLRYMQRKGTIVLYGDEVVESGAWKALPPHIAVTDLGREAFDTFRLLRSALD